MHIYSKTCSLILSALACTALTNCQPDQGLVDDSKPEYAYWSLNSGIRISNSPSTYTNGFLESACDDNHKMFIGISGPPAAGITRMPVLAYGVTPPPNAITLDITDGVGLDNLSLGGDSVDVITTANGTRRINFNRIRVVQAGSSGPTSVIDSLYGYIQLP